MVQWIWVRNCSQPAVGLHIYVRNKQDRFTAQEKDVTQVRAFVRFESLNDEPCDHEIRRM